VTEVDIGGYPIYDVGYSGDKYVKATSNVLRKTGKRAQARIDCEETLQTGACYRIEGHVYHEAIVPEDVATATIVCMHSQSPGAVKVLGLDGYPEKVEFYRSERSAQEFIHLA